MKTGIALFFMLCIYSSLFGQDSSRSARFTAYADAYFAYDFNEPENNRLPYLYNFAAHNTFSINQALLDVNYKSEKVRGAIGIQAGTYALHNYATEPPVFRHIYEAYAGVRLLPRLWLEAGIMPSHIGFESAISMDNLTLTRSLVAENSPYYLSGARLSLSSRNKKWQYAALMVNGWQNIAENNNSKALGTQVSFKPNNDLTFNSSAFAGREDSVGEFWRLFHNLYATGNLSGKSAFAAGFDVGIEENSSDDMDVWMGGALIYRYSITPQLRSNGRVEYYSDRNQVIVQAGNARYSLYGFSVAVDYLPSGNAMFRIEAKYFQAEEIVFIRNGAGVNNSLILTTSLQVRLDVK